MMSSNAGMSLMREDKVNGGEPGAVGAERIQPIDEHRGIFTMAFDPTQFGPDVARIFALGNSGQRLVPLQFTNCTNEEARRTLKALKSNDLFPNQEEPEAPMAALFLYLSCFEEAHQLLEICETPEGKLWHAILHRQEPDSGSAAYWFRKAGPHPIYTPLGRAAAKILHRIPDAEFCTERWDPFAFVAFCDSARLQPGSAQMRAAMEIQRTEWQMLFDYCAKLSERTHSRK